MASRRPAVDHSKLPPIALPPSSAICSDNLNPLPGCRCNQETRPSHNLPCDNYQDHKRSPITFASRSWDDPETPGLDKSFTTSASSSSSDSIHEPIHKFASVGGLQRDKLSYSLKLYQQPRHARMVGNGDKADRRPVDPAPVLRIQLFDSSQRNKSNLDVTLLRSPYFICYSTLCQSNPPYEELFVTPDSGKPYMVGNIVSSSCHLREDDPLLPAGHYFLFSDLGVRVEGLYRLKFSVFEIVDGKVLLCATEISDQFRVCSAKRFEGMSTPSAIAGVLSRQGVRMRLRNKSTTHKSLPINTHKQAEFEGQSTLKRKSISTNKRSSQAKVSKAKLQLSPTELHNESPCIMPTIAKIKMNEEENKHCLLPPFRTLLNNSQGDSALHHPTFFEEEQLKKLSRSKYSST